MMRRVSCSTSQLVGVRTIVGVAPVIHFAQTESKVPQDQQVKKNTNIALNLTKRFKGALPKPYKRRHTQTIDHVEKEIEALLGGAEKLRKSITDDMPMDKLTLMERCLRHGMWSYHKEEGKYDFAEMEKWLVYTPTDEAKLNLLKRSVELKEKYTTFREKRAAAGKPDAPLPVENWTAEYATAVDREIVAEKRFRYDTLAVNTTQKDDAKIDALLFEYRKPSQDARLDSLIDLLERFKPILAREAIMQRLTIKHLEGQLGVWRYLDWSPEVRDRAEMEIDNSCPHWWQPWEEKRLLQVRMRSKKEVADVMEKTQNAQIAESGSQSSSAKAGGNADRERLLKEVLALQARISKKSDDDSKAPEAKKADH